MALRYRIAFEIRKSQPATNNLYFRSTGSNRPPTPSTYAPPW